MSVLGLTFVDIDGQSMAFLQTRFPSFSWGIRKKKPFCRIFTSKNGHLRFFRETALNRLIPFI
jgi:hypothetical protein